MKHRLFPALTAAIALSVLPASLSAQTKLHYWNDAETYLQDQASIIFEQSRRVLAAHPPVTDPGDERLLALFSLDALLHDTRLDDGEAFRSYMKSVVEGVAEGVRSPVPAETRVRIFRLYNDGFIVQTPSVTIAIDLIRGGSAQNPFVDAELLRPIVERCDLLLITHSHGDHADAAVAKMFLERGREVIAPEEFWSDLPAPLLVLRGTDGQMASRTIPLPAGSLKVNAWPGAQDNVPNNVYAITTPEGETIMHTGDQSYSPDVGPAFAARGIKTDVLLVQGWMMPMKEFVSAIDPALVVCGHENEMGHTIDHREAWWLTFRRMAGITVPWVAMAWGEEFSRP
jgi:L-ascorbate metabolism protein UlaG (beta-lactamase superfamily)